jgi:predicted lipoprotein with Yx(FWY)xxD motif
MLKTISAAIVLAAVAVSAPSFGQTVEPAKSADTSKGKALVDAKGMTLYIFDRDSDGKSACSGQCATNWPPFMATGDAKPSGEWTIVTRDDGSKMWAYKGKPLYTWINDKAPGDAKGDGVNNVWHIAAP